LKPEDLPQHLFKTFLPRKMALRVNHWYKFRKADYIIVSYPKCGRTWLRAMLSGYYVKRYGLAADTLLDFANLHYLNREIPRIFLTHDVINNVQNRIVPPEAISTDKSAYYRRNIVYLARDPRDVVVSMYFQRTRRDKNYTGNLQDFIHNDIDGLNTILRFYNVWADSFSHIEKLLLLKYEEMRADPLDTLVKLFEFMGHTPDCEIIRHAIDACSFERMKKMERDNQFSRSWLKAEDVNDDESFKVRRGKIGGYTDYLNAEEITIIEDMIKTRLSPVFGY
jgi:hypothetical protein